MQIKSVTESVLQDLRVRIIVGELAPGSKLKETELSSFFSISRAPLREAFRLLENEHLVIYIPRKGCYVTDISIENCREIYQARTMMECFSVDLLEAKGIRVLPEVESTQEKTANLEMPSGSDAVQKFDYLKAIADFHIKLVEAAGNSQLNYFYHSIFPSLARYQSMYTYITGLMHKSHQEHDHFLKLIKSGDYEHAKENLTSHINKFVLLIEDKIKQDEKTQPLKPVSLFAGHRLMN
jgi:DNA-binding GntR family transcriptional regulator